ncbi:MAG TPA: SDR family NAD(P)-dependent oxidoreductase, partial [Acidimicrobiales bacterium]
AAELAATGIRAEVLATDLGDRVARAALPGRVANLGLTVDVLVNNAGLSTVGPVAKADPDAELHMIEVDVAAVVDLCVRFLPDMVERRRGAILNVASTAAFQPIPGQAGYGGGKAFVLSYTRSMQAELAKTGVTATALCPGPVDTGFGEAAGFAKDEAEAALPSFMWEPADKVAKIAVDALDKGRPVAIPGQANRATAMLAHLTPKRLLGPILASRHPGLRD